MLKYLQQSGLRVPLSSQVSPPSQSALEARGEALLRPGGGRGLGEGVNRDLQTTQPAHYLEDLFVFLV